MQYLAFSYKYLFPNEKCLFMNLILLSLWDQLLFIPPFECLPVRSHENTETISLLLNSYRVHCLLNAIWSGFSVPKSHLQHPSLLFKNHFYGSHICYCNRKELWGPERIHQPPREAAVLPGEHLTPPPFPLLPSLHLSLIGNSVLEQSSPRSLYVCCKPIIVLGFHQVGNSRVLTHQCHWCLTSPLLQMFYQLNWTARLLALLWMDLSWGGTTFKLSSHQLKLIKEETQGYLKHTLEVYQEWGLLGLKKIRKQQNACSQTPSARVSPQSGLLWREVKQV